MSPQAAFDLDVLKSADLDGNKAADLDDQKAADLDDTGKAADLAGKAADLSGAAAAVDRGLIPLERLLGKLMAAMESEPDNDVGERLTPDERRIRNFKSDNGGVGVGDVLADIRGYVDELRTLITRLKARSNLASGITIQVFVAPKS